MRRVGRRDRRAGDLPAGGANFLVGRRLELTQRSAQFTSEDGDNHLISFGEFAALYLMAWCPACWGEVVPNAHVATENDDPTARPQLRWLDTLTEAQRIIYDLEFAYPDRIPEHLSLPPHCRRRPRR